MTEEKVAKINNTQRKKFDEMAREIMIGQIKEAGEALERSRSYAIAVAKAKLGVDKIEARIAELSDAIEKLEGDMETLGFCKHRYSYPLKGSQADTIVEQELEVPRVKLVRLKQETARISEAIWSSSTMAEAKEAFARAKAYLDGWEK